MEIVRTAFQYLAQGGWVMIPLSAGSVALWALIVERLGALRDLRRDDMTVREAIEAVRRGPADVSGIGLRACLVRRFLQERTGVPRLDAHILRHAAMCERSQLERSLSAIAVLVSLAPLLGLLGTVLGMIQTFQVISVFGTGNANAMANGISVALITTEAGLLVAVPGLLLSGMLARQSARLSMQLDEDLTILSRAVRQPVGRDLPAMRPRPADRTRSEGPRNGVSAGAASEGSTR